MNKRVDRHGISCDAEEQRKNILGSDRGVLFGRVLFDHVNPEMPVSSPRGEVKVKYRRQGWSSEELRDDMGRKDRKLGVIATKMVVC